MTVCMRNDRSFPIWQKLKGLKCSIIQELIIKKQLQRYTFYEFIKNLFLIVKTGNYLIVRILVKYVIAHPHDDTL